MEDIAKDEELALVNRIGNASGYKHVSEQRVSEQQAPLLWKLRPRAPRKKKASGAANQRLRLYPGTRYQAGRTRFRPLCYQDELRQSPGLPGTVLVALGALPV